jgi:drug/metabolite transporter (DMT)-like permease
VVLGFTAGTMMAFQSISKRISVIPGLFIWGMVLTFIFAILTLAITQVGFAKARASQVVPSFTSASIVVASVSSIFILGESIFALQYLGIGIIILGVLLLTIFSSWESNEIYNKNNKSLQLGGVNNAQKKDIL